jgi:hypothetical protein
MWLLVSSKLAIVEELLLIQPEEYAILLLEKGLLLINSQP